jgi:hypothetical protein
MRMTRKSECQIETSNLDPFTQIQVQRVRQARKSERTNDRTKHQSEVN